MSRDYSGLTVAAERLSRVIHDYLQYRGKLLTRRGFTLDVRAGHRSEDEEFDDHLLRKGIQAHLAHWGPWWSALEDFLRSMQQDLNSEMEFFHRFLNPSGTLTNFAGNEGIYELITSYFLGSKLNIVVIGVLEGRLKGLIEGNEWGAKVLSKEYTTGELGLAHIQNGKSISFPYRVVRLTARKALVCRFRALQELRDALRPFHQTLHCPIPSGRVLRDRKRKRNMHDL